MHIHQQGVASCCEIFGDWVKLHTPSRLRTLQVSDNEIMARGFLPVELRRDLDDPTKAFLFGRFCLVPDRRALLADGIDVALTSRPFDILLALLERRDRVVLKDELLQIVWHGRVVEEVNLSVHVASLRKLLGSGVITTVSGRGYQFVAAVEEVDSIRKLGNAKDLPLGQELPDRLQTNLPAAASALIGRDVATTAVTTLLETNRVVTLIGAGGIGKTRLAIEVARQMSHRYRDGAWLVELGPLSRGELVPSAIASALRLDIAGRADPIGAITLALQSKQLLLVLDNCEHLIGAVANVVEAVIRAGPEVRILVTSREALRTEGEFQYQVASLTVPDSDTQNTGDLSCYSAVQLFVARARAAQQNLAINEDGLKLVASICRSLDGIPLSIELAAARVAGLGLRQLMDRLDDRFAVLTGGRRTALPRHQTLRATLDWSYELLTETDRIVFGRLAIFAGDFGLDAALFVTTAGIITPAEALESITNLVAKSLVAIETEGVSSRYRLLETTRAYALEKLNLSNERDETAHRHAAYHRDLIEHALAEWQSENTAEWLAIYARRMDDVHAALDWATSPGHDATIGAELTAATVPLWIELSLIDEGIDWTDRAIAALQLCPARTKRHSMVLYAALARLQLYSVTSFKICGDAWAKALLVADDIQDTDFQLHVLWGAYAGSMTGGKFPEALDIANTFLQTANGSLPEELIGHRMIGTALSRLGDQITARMHTELMLDNYRPPEGRSHSAMFGGDQRALARGTFARILWLQGFADQALREVRESCEFMDQDLSVTCHRLIAFGCPVSLWAGQLAEAERYSDILQEFTAERASEMRDHAKSIAGEIALARGDAEKALSLLTPAIDAIRQRGSVQHLTWQLSVMARALAGVGKPAEALTALDEALSRCERFGEGWCRPELIRIKTEVLLQKTGDVTPAIVRQLAEALLLARNQGARAWEIRIATTLAQLRLREGRKREAIDVLTPVYNELTEGFSTPDVQLAKTLLQDLA
jgi:predicted ATPase/DNA-binding winged helix-turn-helix (wHTH) protein